VILDKLEATHQLISPAKYFGPAQNLPFQLQFPYPRPQRPIHPLHRAGLTGPGPSGLLGLTHPHPQGLVVNPTSAGHGRLRATRAGPIQGDSISPELSRVLRHPQQELPFYGSRSMIQ
jgi:hypothetical protein